MTITATGAYEAMLEHHKRLGEGLAVRADAVSAAVAAGRPSGAAVAGLIAYLAGEVLLHAAAEEKMIYPAAVRTGLAGTVEEMIAEHATLSLASARLAAALPALLGDKSVDLAALLEQMHGLAGPERAHVPASSPTAASEGSVLDDHDPKPLRYQFEAEHAGQFTWEYLERGPTVAGADRPRRRLIADPATEEIP